MRPLQSIRAGLFLLVAFGVGSPVFGQVSSRLPAAFLDIGVGARQSAMGYAGLASAHAEIGATQNVASAVNTKGFAASFTYIDQPEVLSYQHLILVLPTRNKKSAVALSVSNTGDDALRELTGRLAFAYRFGPLEFGLEGVYRRATFGRNRLDGGDYVVFDPDEVAQGLGRQVTGNAKGVGLDAGIAVTLVPQVRIGAVVRNITAPVRWNSSTVSGVVPTRGSYTEVLPVTLAFGSSWVASKVFEFALDFIPGLDDEIANRYSLGGEYRLASVLALRAGVQIISDGLKNERYTTGFGVRLPDAFAFRLSADYSFVSDYLSNTQQVTMTIGF